MRRCDVDDCEEKHEARGFCRKHYRRFRLTGDPHTVLKRGRKPWLDIAPEFRQLACDYELARRTNLEITPEMRYGVNEYHKAAKRLRRLASS